MVKKLVKAASYFPKNGEDKEKECKSQQELQLELIDAKKEIKIVFEKANYFKEKLARCNEESELIEDEFVPGDDGMKPNYSDDDE